MRFKKDEKKQKEEVYEIRSKYKNVIKYNKRRRNELEWLNIKRMVSQPRVVEGVTESYRKKNHHLLALKSFDCHYWLCTFSTYMYSQIESIIYVCTVVYIDIWIYRYGNVCTVQHGDQLCY